MAATRGLAPPSLLVGALLTNEGGLAPRTLAELLLRVGVAAGELQGVGGTHLDGRGWWCFVVEMEGDVGRCWEVAVGWRVDEREGVRLALGDQLRLGNRLRSKLCGRGDWVS